MPAGLGLVGGAGVTERSGDTAKRHHQARDLCSAQPRDGQPPESNHFAQRQSTGPPCFGLGIAVLFVAVIVRMIDSDLLRVRRGVSQERM